MTTSMRSLAVAVAAAAAFAFLPRAAFAATKTVVCKDGTTAAAGRGACSGHGGVDKAATSKAKAEDAAAKKEARAKKAQEKAEAKAKAKKDAGEAKAKKERAKAEPKAAGGEAAATVVCKDGSTSKAGRGACRGHGGVDKGASAKGAAPAASPPAHREAPAPAAARPAARERPDAAKGPATARCKDGTLSHAQHHTGACSNHGGVAEWLDTK